MSENQPIWIAWARTLQHWGINKGVASLLEVTGSISILFAQLLYLSQPLLSGVVSARTVDTFASVLEDPVARQQFLSVLREETTRERAA